MPRYPKPKNQAILLKKFEMGMLELIFGALMVIGIIGYFSHVAPDLDWLDHTISFALFTYLFFRLRVSSILFGKRDAKTDGLIVLSFFLLFFKDILAYTLSASDYSFWALNALRDYFGANQGVITDITFHLGVLGLVVASSIASKSIIAHPSLGYAITQGRENGRVFRGIFGFVLLLAFYYFVYNSVLEWLEFVLDDPIIVLGLLFYLHSLVLRKERFHTSSFVFRIGDFSEGIYTRFVSLFHFRKTLALGVMGLLILHALSDLGVYAYTLSFGQDNFYLEQLGEERLSFMEWWEADSKVLPSLSLPLGMLYALNGLALWMLLAVPIVVWWKMTRRQALSPNRAWLFLIFSCGAAYILYPGFALVPLLQDSIAGIDISSFSILGFPTLFASFFPTPDSAIWAGALLSILSGIIAYLLSARQRWKNELFGLSVLGSLTFYGIYIYYFMGSVLLYFTTAIIGAFMGNQFVLGIVLVILIVLITLFYVGTYIIFLYEVLMETLLKKWSKPLTQDIGKIKRILGKTRPSLRR